MSQDAYLNLAREVLRDIQSGDDTLPDEVRQRSIDPRNCFLHYVFVRKAGEGAMATVWKAWHLELRRFVALKLLRSTLRPEAALRFAREAQLGAELIHPNIIRVHNHGAHNGAHFIEMDYVESVTLEAFLAPEGGVLKDRVALLVPICRAAAYAHGKGVVHRDINPKNILMGLDDGTPRLTDFGLAKALDGPTDLTGTGRIMGTPRYMSPEQAAGKEAGPASDIYSLGSVLYRVVTGQPPFGGDSVLGIARQVDASDPVRPSRLEPRTDEELERIVLKAMQRSPKDRYASADEMADDLERWLGGRPVLATAPRSAGRARLTPLRRPLLLRALLMLTLVGLGIGWLGTYFSMRREIDRLRAAAGVAPPHAPHRAAATGTVIVPATAPGRSIAALDPWQYAWTAGALSEASEKAALEWDHTVYRHIRRGVWGEPFTAAAVNARGGRAAADRALVTGDDERALQGYVALTSEPQSDPLVWLGAAFAAYRLNRPDETLAYLSACLRVLPREDEEPLEGTACAYALQALCYVKKDNRIAAARAITLACQIEHANSYATDLYKQIVTSLLPRRETSPRKPSEPASKAAPPPPDPSALVFRPIGDPDEDAIAATVKKLADRFAAVPSLASWTIRYDGGRSRLTITVRAGTHTAEAEKKAVWLATRRGALTARILAPREVNDATAWPKTAEGFKWGIVNLSYPAAATAPLRWRLMRDRNLEMDPKRFALAHGPVDGLPVWTYADHEGRLKGAFFALLLDGEIFWYGPCPESGSGTLHVSDEDPQMLIPTLYTHGPLETQFERCSP